MNQLGKSASVEAPFSAVIDYVADFFVEHPDLRVKAVAATSVPVETRSELIEDATDTVRRHDALALSWGLRWRAFPIFNGTLSVRPDSYGAILTLEGSYDPPGGLLGRIFDRLIGKRLALGTMTHLIKRLRIYIRRRHRKFQQLSPTIDQLNARSRTLK